VEEWLATLTEKIPPTPHCMEKSAEVIDEKGVAMAPLRKRVRNRLTSKEIDRERTPRLRSG
jgi:hypothetical protein